MLFSSSQYIEDDFDVQQKMKVKYELLRSIYRATLNDSQQAKNELEGNKRCLQVCRLHESYIKMIADSPFAKLDKFPKKSIINDLFGITF